MSPAENKLDQVVAEARRQRELREQGYREQALKLYPHICGRCGREFMRKNLHELTVHHRDHNHDNNPIDGSNWELLCVYCHDNEHQRQQASGRVGDLVTDVKSNKSTHKPFADLGDLLQTRKK